MRPTFLCAMLQAGMLVSTPTCAQNMDTSRWKLEQNTIWGFAVSLPPGWTVLDMPVAALRLVIRQEMPDGRTSMCQVQANSQSETADLSQSQLNDYVAGKGPPSRQDLTTATGTASSPVTVHSTELIWVNGLPAYGYDVSNKIRSTVNPVHQRTRSEWIYVPGRSYGVSCTAASGNAFTSDALYERNLPIFRGFLDSFLVIPPRVN